MTDISGPLSHPGRTAGEVTDYGEPSTSVGGEGGFPVSGHGAAASASGYLYQTNWALVELLREGKHRPDQSITLEMHDDVGWTAMADSADARELLQLKLHPAGGSAGLGDMATDIWKTLKVWMDRPDATDPSGPELCLVTTSTASSGSAAHALKPPSSDSVRDVSLAVNRLVYAAGKSQNDETQVAREQFLALGLAGQSALISRVRVLDAQMPLEDLDAAVRDQLFFALPTGGMAAEQSFLAQVWHW